MIHWLVTTKGGLMRNEFDRFIDKVNKTDSCWIWTGSKYRGGYGQFRRLVEGKWKMAKTHRYSYEYFKGEIPKGHFICHTCDNPSCVNPEHLFSGTLKDNAKDMLMKGRNKYGRNPKHNWLDWETVDNIRKDHTLGLSYNDLCVKYKQSKAQISRVIKQVIWKRKVGTENSLPSM
jgi:hypothetical protein